jgi:two-component system sensor histidine kinase DegS
MYQMDDLREMLHDTHGMQILEEFNSTIHRVVNSLRATCGELRPPSLSPFGLEVAIRDHVEKLHGSHPNLQVHLDLMRDQQILSDGIRLCLFRIYQQAISNVIRHSQATDAYVRFRWDDEIVTLEVEDNGSGFELPERWVDLVRQECFGLVGIAERVESVQGNLGIRSTPGNGTLIQVSVPRR